MNINTNPFVLPIRRGLQFLLTSLSIWLFWSCGQPVYELENKKIKARLSIDGGKLLQEYYARSGNSWQLVVRSSSPAVKAPLPLYDTAINAGSRYLSSNLEVTSITEQLQERGKTLVVSGKQGEAIVRFSVSLGNEDEYFHLEQVSGFRTGTPVEYILSDFQFEAGTNSPEFVHTPALKFEETDIIGDRVFWSPALIMQEKGLFAALVPDADIINKNIHPVSGARPIGTGKGFRIPVDSTKISFPTGLDLHTDIDGSNAAIFSYGYIDAIAEHHMHWNHPNDSSMVHYMPAGDMRYGFDLFIGAEKERYYGYQQVTQFIWNKYGRPEFDKSIGLAMPLDEYARLCYPASAAYKGSELMWHDGVAAARHYREKKPSYESFLSWTMNGIPVGGYRNNAPQWYDMIGNTTWWNNVRDAVGMYQWGERLGDRSLKEKASRVINLALTAPQQEGAFPVIFAYEQKKWKLSHWGPPMDMDSSRNERYFDSETSNYHTSGMSKTALHLLRYYIYCEQRPEILEYAKRYAAFLQQHIDPNGCVPAFFNKDLQPNPHLRINGAGGIHIWFLTTLYNLTQQQEYLRLAEKIAAHLETNILPGQDWKDFEVYFSCGVKPMNFHDHFTSQPPRNTLSMYWAVEGFTGMYNASGQTKYLDLAQKAADYLSLYQASWQPHYITTAYAFGGFGVQNTDAEWLDARQGEIAPAFVRLGILTQRQDLIERGVAAARASLILVNHERHKQNGLYVHTNFPEGLGPENIDHEGFPQSPMRTNAGWGEVSGLSGIADILHQMGDLYIDRGAGIVVPLNGIRVSQKPAAGPSGEIVIQNALERLSYPYPDTLSIQVHTQGKGNEQAAASQIRTEGKIRLSTLPDK